MAHEILKCARLLKRFVELEQNGDQGKTLDKGLGLVMGLCSQGEAGKWKGVFQLNGEHCRHIDG